MLFIVSFIVETHIKYFNVKSNATLTVAEIQTIKGHASVVGYYSLYICVWKKFFFRLVYMCFDSIS